MADTPRIDVLIVSLCLAQRAHSIRRTVAAALDQAGVAVRLVIVVNGARFDKSLYDELAGTPGIEVLYQSTPSIFLARRLAREHVEAPYFCFIDDDDVYLPNALRTRVGTLESDASLDAVVTAGWLETDRGDVPMLEHIDAVRADPLMALLRSNWLATASATFRTSTVGTDYFDPTLRSNDMTYLGFRLALERRVAFIEEATYRKTYSSDSISLSDQWVTQSLDTIERLLALQVPARVRPALRNKATSIAHEVSDLHLRRGRLAQAWWFHLRSLATLSGFYRYWRYTRHLIAKPAGGSRISSTQ